MNSEQSHPKVIIISGPNGAGKSTAAPELFQGELSVGEFVNADVIARGLSAFESVKMAVKAGRIMLTRLKELADQRATFAFETTLASKTFAPWIAELKKTGCQFHLLYLWIPSAEMAVSRVAQRVQRQGHYVPDDVVRRRYLRGLSNFFRLYQPMATRWEMYYNGGASGPGLVADGGLNLPERIVELDIWNRLKTEVSNGIGQD